MSAPGLRNEGTKARRHEGMDRKAIDPISEEIEAIGYRVIGCGQTVHRLLGPGFPERIYHRAMCLELAEQGLPFESEKRIEVYYKNRKVGVHRLDLAIAGVVIVELKVIPRVLEVHRRQVLSYLKATGLRLGYVMNFNSEVLKDGTKRVVN
jgi:GxxExxY protein